MQDRNEKVVSIIGCAQGWQDAPIDGESWGITSLVLKRPVSCAFDMHDLEQTKEQWIKHYTLWLGKYYGRNYIRQKAKNRIETIPKEFAEINRLRIPFYSVREYSKAPTSILYPIDKIKQAFKDAHPFSGTFDYLAALALYRGFERIDIYGVKMDSTDEYAHQLISANYWLGRCIGKGVEINVHGESMLLRTIAGFDYGYNS